MLQSRMRITEELISQTEATSSWHFKAQGEARFVTAEIRLCCVGIV